MAPQLALSYSSQAPIYGTIAAGWSLSIPEIREDTSQGRLATRDLYWSAFESDPRANDRFTSSLAGGRPLIKVNDSFGAGVYGAYRAQNDNSFARYDRMEPGQGFAWRVWALDGSMLYFGEPSRTVGCLNVSEGYAPLTSVVDVFGNSVFYEWESGVADECRLKQITWGRNANAFITQPFAKVELTWVTSAECPGNTGYIGSQIDYRSGTKIVTGASKLTAIKATAFPFGGDATPEHTRLITLGYSSSTESCTAPHSPMRQLASIQESAWRANEPQVNLPAVTFQYGTAAISMSQQSTPIAPPWTDVGANLPAHPWNLGWGSRAPTGATDKWPTVESMMVDMDGDGLLDRLYSALLDGNGNCRATWQRGQGVSSSGALLPFVGAQTITLPRLRWHGQSPTMPVGGTTSPGTATPYYEGCALNGQATAYDNITGPHSEVRCHDGSLPQFSSTPGLTSEQFCYSPGEFGLQAPASGGSVDCAARQYRECLTTT